MSTCLQSPEPEYELAPERCVPDRVLILGVPVDNLSMSEAIDAIVARLDGDRPAQICFLNADCVNLSRRDRRYLDVLSRADLVLADGIGVKLAAAADGIRLRDNVNGTDLFPRLCASLGGTGKRLFLLGARPGVAEAVCHWIGRHYPAVEIAGCRHGYFSPDEEPAVVDEIARSGVDLLLVAFGAPRQDLWIDRLLGSLGVKVALGVGGLLDFYSGRIPRAPRWMRRFGLEWLYRLYREPGRLWRRYLLGNAVFLLRVAVERAKRLWARFAGSHSKRTAESDC